MFEGDLKKGIPAEFLKAFAKTAKKQGAKGDNVNNIVNQQKLKLEKDFS